MAAKGYADCQERLVNTIHEFKPGPCLGRGCVRMPFDLGQGFLPDGFPGSFGIVMRLQIQDLAGSGEGDLRCVVHRKSAIHFPGVERIQDIRITSKLCRTAPVYLRGPRKQRVSAALRVQALNWLPV